MQHQAPPSGLQAISPSRGEIDCFSADAVLAALEIAEGWADS
jgi:hypothetical protein